MIDSCTKSRKLSLMEQILYEVKKVIVGQDHFLERVLVAILSHGHLLVEGVPGLAKTLTVKTLAEAVQGAFKRIQFTPDLVPADLVGTRIYNQKTGAFSTSLGPVFTNLLLADEINRAPAKVQSALLEVMQERQVTIGGETFPVAESLPGHGDPEPHRNRGDLPAARSPGRPLHDEGAGGLPHRGGRVRDRGAHDRTVGTDQGGGRQRAADRAADAEREGVCRPGADAVRGAPGGGDPGSRDLRIPDLARYIMYGASPRASIYLIVCARSLAFLRGRGYVMPQDVVDVVPDVMRHRLVLSYEALSDAVSADAMLHRIMEHIPAPAAPLESHVTVGAES